MAREKVNEGKGHTCLLAVIDGKGEVALRI